MAFQDYERVVDKETLSTLEEKYQQGELPVTGRIVTNRIPTNLVEEGLAKQLEENYQMGQIEGIETTYLNSVPVQEYEYNGKKYARVKAEFGTNENNLRFSDGKEIISGQTYWLHVEPLVKMFGSNQVFMPGTTKQQEKSDVTEFLKNYIDSNKSSNQNKEWMPQVNIETNMALENNIENISKSK